MAFIDYLRFTAQCHQCVQKNGVHVRDDSVTVEKKSTHSVGPTVLFENCDASLILTNAVLTAAHCVVDDWGNWKGKNTYLQFPSQLQR